MTLLSIDDIATRVAAHDAVTYDIRPTTRQAAVAAILRGGQLGTEILFIKRASKDGDPWSGDMAFPGGHREDDDRDLKLSVRPLPRHDRPIPILDIEEVESDATQ